MYQLQCAIETGTLCKVLQTSETGVRDVKTLYYLLDCSVDLKLFRKRYIE